MVSIICTKCLDKKNSTEFGKDVRNSTGFKSQCNDCSKQAKAVKVNCDQCNKTFRKDTLSRHKKVCKGNLVQQIKGLKSNGLDRIECSCKHARCIGMVNESVSYKHLRYGEAYWKSLDKAAAARKLKLKQQAKALKQEQLDDQIEINKILRTMIE